MNRKFHFHRAARACGLCLPLLLITGLAIPGCAGNRSDMLSSLIKPKQAETATAGEQADDEGTSALITGVDKQQKTSRLSAFSDAEIIEGRPRLRHRVRSLFSREDEATTAGDPFLQEESKRQSSEAAEDRKAIASSEQGRVDDMLASFQNQEQEKEPITKVKPWWETGTTETSGTPAPAETATASADTPPKAAPKTTFSRQFDSRLERLRAELDLDDKSIADTEKSSDTSSTPAAKTPRASGVPTHAAIEVQPKIAARNAQEANATAVDDVAAQQLPVVVGNARTGAEPATASLMTQPRLPAHESQNAPAASAADAAAAADARQQVLALMDEARQDQQAWKLHRAYQTVVAAHKIAVREKVRFRAGEEQPRDLARKIAADVKKDALARRSGSAPRAFASNPFRETDDLGIRSAAATFGFDELERLANPWTAKPADQSAAATPRPALAGARPAESQDSGVSLMPPEDDFPSDAAGRDWNDADPRDIRLATHKFPDFRSADKQIRGQMKGLSASDNEALLQNIADQKNRVLTSKGIVWPRLPKGHQPLPRVERGDGPIRVAQAPQFALEDDLAVTPVPAAAAKADPSSGSLLGQFWRSQPIWFIGGLVLLVMALRLWPSSKPEDV